MAESTIACVCAVPSQKVAAEGDAATSPDHEALLSLHLDDFDICLFLVDEGTPELLAGILLVIPKTRRRR
mgnify:FL=1